jgi:long-subunit fatty acid transport protein
MKKILFTVVIALTATIAQAQIREKGNFEYINQIGYSSANYNGEGVNLDNKPVNAVSYGLGGDYYFNNRWSLRSGLLFQTMGTKSGLGIFKDELQYLTIPVNANWHFGSTRKWNLNFGPSIGFLTSANTNGIDIRELVNSTQIGFNYGIGYKIEVSNKISILIDYQAMTGLTDVAKDSDFKIKNVYSSFNAGCVFKL